MNSVCIITALAAESRPFIDALRLRHQADHALRLYTGEQFILLQSGMGKLKAAAHTAALLHARPDIIGVINIGLAGGIGAIGNPYIAHEIKDAATSERWYPHLPPQRIVDNLPSRTVQTLDSPSADYQNSILFDMEAAGIISAASTYLPSDAVQSIKVISDNSEQTLHAINPAMATESLQIVVPLVRKLGQWLLQNHPEDDFSQQVEALMSRLLKQARHSTTQQHSLRRLLQRFISINEDIADNDPVFSLDQAKSISRHLNQALIANPLAYEQP